MKGQEMSVLGDLANIFARKVVFLDGFQHSVPDEALDWKYQQGSVWASLAAYLNLYGRAARAYETIRDVVGPHGLGFDDDDGQLLALRVIGQGIIIDGATLAGRLRLLQEDPEALVGC